MLTFITYFDSGFLVRGLACLESLVARSADPIALVVLALDEPCAAALPLAIAPLPSGCRLRVITLAELEARHPALAAVRPHRSRLEYYFTLTPIFCADVLGGLEPGAQIVYVDADMFCFADPAAALAEAEGADVIVTEHRFPARTGALAELYGRFNVGWLAFRRTQAAIGCVRRWAGQCLEWCSLVPKDGAFGDQKYLDDWPRTVESFAVLAHPGVNAAPWNVARHRFAVGRAGVEVDGRPLVTFHFHRVRRLGPRRYDTDYRDYGRLPAVLREHVYLPYLAALDAIEARLAAAGLPNMPPATVAGPDRDHAARRSRLRALAGRIARMVRLFTRRRVVFADGRALNPLQAMRGPARA